MLIKNPDILITRKTYLYDRCETLWIWKVQLNQFPSVVALSQPSRTQCQCKLALPNQKAAMLMTQGFLECRLILPSCEIFHTDTLSSPASLKIRRKNHAVIWILVKSEKDQTPSTSTSPEVLLECKVVFTTLEDCEIPEKPDDAILIPCIKQLADEWIQVFQAAENHLSQMV